MKQSVSFQRYLFIWFGVAVVFGGLVFVNEYFRNPLHDADQAMERQGILLPASTYKSPRVDNALPRVGERTIIFFTRSLSGQQLFPDLADQADIASLADMIVVTEDGSRPHVENGINLILTDQDAHLATAFGLRRPIDEGYPIGYVIIDTTGFIRYRTLDYGFMERAADIKIILNKTP